MAGYSNCKCMKCGASFDSGGLNVDFGEYTPYDDSPRYGGPYDIYPSSADQVLETKGMLLEEDITVHKTDISDFNLQEKTITPSSETQVVLPDGPSGVKVWDEYSGYNYVSSGNANSIRLEDLETPRYARLNGKISFKFDNSEPEIFTFNNVIVERMDWTQSAYLYRFYSLAGASLYSGSVEKSGNLTYDSSITGISVRKYHLDSYGTFALTYDEPSNSGLTFENVTLEFSDDPAFPAGFDGLSKVVVNAAPLQEKTVTPNLQTQIVAPDEIEKDVVLNHITDSLTIDSSDRPFYGYIYNVNYFERKRYARLNGLVKMTRISVGSGHSSTLRFTNTIAEMVQESSTHARYTFYDYENPSPSVEILSDSSIFGSREFHIFSYNINTGSYAEGNTGLIFSGAVSSGIWKIELTDVTLEFSDDPSFSDYYGLSQVIVNPIGQWFADQGYIFVSTDETLIYGDWDEAVSRITNGDEIPTSCCIMINGVSMQPTFWIETDNEDLNLPAIRISASGYSVLWFEDGTLLIDEVDPF